METISLANAYGDRSFPCAPCLHLNYQCMITVLEDLMYIHYPYIKTSSWTCGKCTQ